MKLLGNYVLVSLRYSKYKYFSARIGKEKFGHVRLLLSEKSWLIISKNLD